MPQAQSKGKVDAQALRSQVGGAEAPMHPRMRSGVIESLTHGDHSGPVGPDLQYIYMRSASSYSMLSARFALLLRSTQLRSTRAQEQEQGQAQRQERGRPASRGSSRTWL